MQGQGLALRLPFSVGEKKFLDFLCSLPLFLLRSHSGAESRVAAAARAFLWVEGPGLGGRICSRGGGRAQPEGGLPGAGEARTAPSASKDSGIGGLRFLLRRKRGCPRV